MAKKAETAAITKIENDYLFEGSKDTYDAKVNFLKYYLKSYHIGKSATAAGIRRESVYRWRKEDLIFEKAFNEVEEYLKDDAEACLRKSCKNLDPSSIKFLLNKKAADRGYGDKPIDITGGLVIKWDDSEADEVKKDS